MEILGVRIDELNADQAQQKIEGFLKGTIPKGAKPHYLITLNPELVIAAQKDEEFKKIINQADLVLADGIGLKLAVWLRGKKVSRLTGADLTEQLLAWASQHNLRVAIVIWSAGLSRKEEIALALARKYPDLRFWVRDDTEKELAEAEILLAALGAPFQEKFIYQNLEKITDLRLALGVGGSFDFLTGQQRRAPKILRQAGLEWLWRFLRQPQRAKRIFNAVIKFPWMVIWSKK